MTSLWIETFRFPSAFATAPRRTGIVAAGLSRGLVIAALALLLAPVARGEGVAATPERVVSVRIPAPSMRGNRLSQPDSMPIAVYLPPSYATSGRRYPVVYYLPGFGDRVADVVGNRYGFSLPGSVDSCIAAGKAHEFVFVVVNGFNNLGGSFYANSPVTGRWEDWVARDVVGYVDAHFRTLARPPSRGLAGHSMGGSGALRIGMRNERLFGAVYAMSPGLFAPGGLERSAFLSESTAVKMAREDSLLAASPADARLERLVGDIQAAQDWELLLAYAYGAAFAPDTSQLYPYMRRPCRIVGGRRVVDAVVAHRWEAGFGSLSTVVRGHAAALRGLRGLGIEFGTRDDVVWIPDGCRYLSGQLDAIGVRHRLVAFEGGHDDHLGERLRIGLLPFFSETLAFE